MTEHTLIQNGDGCHCSVCGMSWDRDEERGQCDDVVHPNGILDADLPAVAPLTLVLSGVRSITSAEAVARANSPFHVPPEGFPGLKNIDWSKAPLTQVGGNHYQGMGIQPRDFAIRNRYDPDAFSILKYISRHRRKAGREDVLKALHFAEMRMRDFDLYGLGQWPKTIYSPIPMAAYITNNGITDTFDQNCLFSLQNWVRHRHHSGGVDHVDQIRLLLSTLPK